MVVELSEGTSWLLGRGALTSTNTVGSPRKLKKAGLCAIAIGPWFGAEGETLYRPCNKCPTFVPSHVVPRCPRSFSKRRPTPLLVPTPSSYFFFLSRPWSCQGVKRRTRRQLHAWNRFERLIRNMLSNLSFSRTMHGTHETMDWRTHLNFPTFPSGFSLGRRQGVISPQKPARSE